MKAKVQSYIIEFVVFLTIFINQIQFLVFSFLGIDYDAEDDNSLIAILNVCFFAICIIWITINMVKNHNKAIRIWPILLIIIVISMYILESAFNPNVDSNLFARKQLMFFGVFSVPAILLAMYICNYNRFDIITRNMDIIMLLCTVSLILNIPSMLSDATYQTIGGGGGHQEISYNAAFCFAINLTNLLSGNKEDRYTIFTKKVFKYISFVLLPIQVVICILGGGRGGGVFLVLSFFIIMMLYSRKNFSKTLFICGSCLILLLFFYFNTDIFSSGFGRTFDYFEGGVFSLENNQSDIERTKLRQLSYGLIAQSPLWGYGLWNGLVVSGYYMHNIFLDILIAGGFIYLIIFLAFIRQVYKNVRTILVANNNMCTLLPIILLPATMLMFSGYYLTNSLFWFCFVFALMWKNKQTIL